MKKVAILQSNYIPWKGYFDLIASVDEFIVYDDMQFTKNDWRNRNKIKTPKGLEWLSIPVGQDINRRIRDVVITNSLWQEKHWKTLVANYSRAPHFNEVSSLLEPIYRKRKHTYLSAVNRELIEAVCGFLGISTVIKNSWDYMLGEGKTERLVDLCQQADATEYISGPAARNYLDPKIFTAKNIKLSWFEYNGYSEYPQLWGEFQHGVSIIDLLFNCGKSAPRHMRFFSTQKGNP
jgi:WbqC-like protein family